MWKSLVTHPLICIAHVPCIIWEYTAEAGDGKVGIGLAWVACGCFLSACSGQEA